MTMTPTDLSPNQAAQLEALLSLLESETRQMELTRDQLNTKQQVLVSGKAKQLSAIDRELMAMARKAQELAKTREQVTAELGYANQSLKDMIAQVPAQFTPRFITSRDRLKRAAMDVERLNRENRDLLELSLRWVQETVAVIATALHPEGACYNAQGGKKTPAANGQDALPAKSTVIHSA